MGFELASFHSTGASSVEIPRPAALGVEIAYGMFILIFISNASLGVASQGNVLICEARQMYCAAVFRSCRGADGFLETMGDGHSPAEDKECLFRDLEALRTRRFPKSVVPNLAQTFINIQLL